MAEVAQFHEPKRAGTALTAGPGYKAACFLIARLHHRWNNLLRNSHNWLAAIIVTFSLQISLILTHSPWLDEIQAVQLAVEAPDLPTLLQWLRYEGHPPLFYLLLRSLAYFTEPLRTLPLLALMLAVGTQSCILFRSPFTRAERILISTTTFFLFDFLTLSRSLNLGVFLVVLAVSLRRSPWSWLAIILLPMCDFLFGVLSVALVLLKIRDRDISWPGITLWLASGLLATYLVIPPADMLPAMVNKGIAVDVILYFLGLGTLAIPFQGGSLVTWNLPAIPLAIISWIPFLLLCWSSTRRDKLHRILLLSFVLLTFVFSIFVYALAIRHLMLIALLLIVLAWKQREVGVAPQVGFRLWLMISSLCGLATAAINFAMPFNTSARAAAAIERRGLAKSHWMVWPDNRAQGVSAYSGMDFERTERHCMQSAIRWNYRSTLITRARMLRYLSREVKRHGRFYLLSDVLLTGFPVNLLRPIQTISAGYDGQDFHLYVVGPLSSERPVNLPPCIPDRRPFSKLWASGLIQK